MPINPCGAVCALGRRPYRVKVRPFKDDDTEVWIQWYEARPDAPCLDVPSFITPLDWFVQERSLGVFEDIDIGEVADSPRPYSNFKAPKCADGQHRCGTEDEWANGAVYDPSRSIPQRGDGLPACCPCEPEGILIGGRSINLDNTGVVVSGESEWQTIQCQQICMGFSTATIPDNGLVSVLTPLSADPNVPTLQARFQLATFQTSRFRYLRGQPGGTVRVRHIQIGVTCLASPILYEGPSEVPFEFIGAAAPSPHFAYNFEIDMGSGTVEACLVVNEPYVP